MPGGESDRHCRTHAQDATPAERNRVKTLKKLLGSQRGDLLIDSMIGAVIIAIIMAAAGTVLIGAASASSGNDTTTTRSILLNTVLSDEKPNLAKYTDAPQTLARTAGGQDVSVAIWREEPAPGMSVLNAATKRPSKGADGADCAGPDRLDSSKCLSSRTTITTSNAGIAIASVTLSPGTTGALKDFTVPAGATELRYVFKVTEASADSTLTFGNRDHPDIKHAVKIPAGHTGYFYGRILVNGGAKLFLQTSGPATIDAGSILIYEAPKP
jgi:hypothetical protein